MSYTSSGKIPAKFIIKVHKDVKKHTMQYFNTRHSVTAAQINSDFNLLNKSLETINSPLYTLKAYTTPHIGPKEIVLDNVPRKIRVIGAVENNECRSSYGSNFNVKVLLSDEYVCLLSADILIDICVNNLLGENGEVNAEFVIAQGNGSTQLIRKDSGVYNICQAHMEEMKRPTMKNLAFEYGKVYKKVSSERYGVFLGYITTTAMTIKNETEKTPANFYEIKKFDIKRRKVKMGSIWYEFGSWAMQKDLDQVINNQIQSGELYNFKCYLANSHKYVTETDKQINLAPPKDVIYAIANKAYKKCSKVYDDMLLRLADPNYRAATINPNRYFNYDNSVRYYEIRDLYAISPFVNLEIYGCSPKANPIYENIEKKVLPGFKLAFNNSSSRYKPH